MGGQLYIRMHHEEIGINAGHWVDSAQDSYYWRALVNAALNLRDPLATELVSTSASNLSMLCSYLQIGVTPFFPV